MTFAYRLISTNERRGLRIEDPREPNWRYRFWKSIGYPPHGSGLTPQYGVELTRWFRAFRTLMEDSFSDDGGNSNRLSCADVAALTRPAAFVDSGWLVVTGDESFTTEDPERVAREALAYRGVTRVVRLAAS